MTDCANCKYFRGRCKNDDVVERVNVYEEVYLEIDGITFTIDDCPKYEDVLPFEIK